MGISGVGQAMRNSRFPATLSCGIALALTAPTFAKLDDAQAKAVVEAIASNGWAHDKTDVAMQSAIEALVYVAAINDKGKAFTAAP